MRKLRNPIIPGYYPDPSIIRVEDDFYLVNSSFEMFPGLPVFHSRDLMHWEQIANAMSAENGFHMEKNTGVGGLMAPTIRYYNGTYYIINANFADKGNYIITATDPKGPWSAPHWMNDVPGIDASIFFDTDGSCYVCGTGDVWDDGSGRKSRGIWIAAYDVKNFRCTGEPFAIFGTAMTGGASPEAPHLYHIGEYYYLMTAEGGTEHYHSVMVARSRTLFDHFEGDPANPVMTQRQMGFRSPIINVGHADLVELKDGSWYAMMLGSRLIDGKCKNLGRETFICPVVWEREWPLFSPESGKMEWDYPAPADLKPCLYPKAPARAVFEDDRLPLEFVTWGTPERAFWNIDHGSLHLSCIPQKLDEELEPMRMDGVIRSDRCCAFIARRQCQMYVSISTRMNFLPKHEESAGIAVVQAMNHQLHIERACEEGRQVLRAVLVTADYNRPPYFPGFTSTTKRREVACVPYEDSDIVLKIDIFHEEFVVRYGKFEMELNEMCCIDGALINPEKVGCMCGTLLGMYATGNGQISDNEAEFKWFEYLE